MVGMIPPWMLQQMQGMGQQSQAPMTPGAGMPPQSNAPQSRPVQMPTPNVAQGAPMQAPQQGQGPGGALNNSQMGMLSQMLGNQTKQPNIPMPSAQGMEGVIEGMSGEDARKYAGGLTGGLLGQWFPGMFG